jgi:F0F1-type ATP synthase assembly protein I
MNSNHFKGLAVAAHITGYIVGPLLIFGAIGWYIDKTFQTTPFALLVSILIAFILTNVLIFKRASEVVKTYAIPKSEKKADKASESDTSNSVETQ